MNLVNKTIDNIRKSPLNWRIELYKFNDYGKEQLVEPLVDVLENVVSKALNANQRNIMFYYQVGERIYNEKLGIQSFSNHPVSKPISYDSWNELIKVIKENGLIYNPDEDVSFEISFLDARFI